MLRLNYNAKIMAKHLTQRIVDLRPAVANRFHLRPAQGHAGLEALVHEVVAQRLGVADFGVAGLVFGFGGLVDSGWFFGLAGAGSSDGSWSSTITFVEVGVMATVVWVTSSTACFSTTGPVIFSGSRFVFTDGGFSGMRSASAVGIFLAPSRVITSAVVLVLAGSAGLEGWTVGAGLDGFWGFCSAILTGGLGGTVSTGTRMSPMAGLSE